MKRSVSILPLFLVSVCVIALLGCSDETMMTSPDATDDTGINEASFRSGGFTPSAGTGKESTGTARLVMLESGMLRLDFSDDFSLTPGPGLFVFLSTAEFPSLDAINLGDFISSQGPQMYAVPEGVSLDSFSYVVVHCVPYDVTFAYAELN